MPHDLFKELPLNPVIGLTHIKFKSHVTKLPLGLTFKIMESLKSNKNVIRDETTKEESSLRIRYHMRQN